MFKKKKCYLITLVTIVLILNTKNFAQEIPELITDRPGQANTASIVPIDFLQIEMGFLYQRQKFSDGNINVENDNLILGSTLLRLGISPKIEFRFGGEYPAHDWRRRCG